MTREVLTVVVDWILLVVLILRILSLSVAISVEVGILFMMLNRDPLYIWSSSLHLHRLVVDILVIAIILVKHLRLLSWPRIGFNLSILVI